MSKILIIEDDKFLRDLLIKKINEANYETIYAVDGEEGLKKIRDEKPDLVLLDLILPGLNGFDVLEQIKTDASTKNTPVLILSNLGQADDIKRGISLGAEDFLIKAHFILSEIIDKIGRILKEK